MFIPVSAADEAGRLGLGKQGRVAGAEGATAGSAGSPLNESFNVPTNNGYNFGHGTRYLAKTSVARCRGGMAIFTCME
jgi:hypothetical protein